tara:strand:+ start:326 stop:478 length:153 start_codon:yes stop_codon:yes gene_type:complete
MREFFEPIFSGLAHPLRAFVPSSEIFVCQLQWERLERDEIEKAKWSEISF